MKLYTKTGDNGSSSLYNGTRVQKTSMYFKLLGDLDELNSHIGMAKSLWKNLINENEIKVYSAPGAGAGVYRHAPSVNTGLYYEWYNTEVLTQIQCIIMDISSFIASPPWDESNPIKGEVLTFIDEWKCCVGIDKNIIKNIESFIDRLDSLVPPITNFVVPGNNTLLSSIHICRTIVRRCERSYLEFLEGDLNYYTIYDEVDCEFKTVQIYLNRLSDMFFALTRFLAMSLGVQEDLYSKQKNLFQVFQEKLSLIKQNK